VLLRLVTHHVAGNVVNACRVLNALGHTGVYREVLIGGGVKDVMQRITKLVIAFFPHLPVETNLTQTIHNQPDSQILTRK
jgi:hypothetical protein